MTEEAVLMTMKKFRALLLTMLLGAALAACGGNAGNNPNVDSPAAGDETPQAGEGAPLGSDTGTDGSGTTVVTPEAGTGTTTP